MGWGPNCVQPGGRPTDYTDEPYGVFFAPLHTTERDIFQKADTTAPATSYPLFFNRGSTRAMHRPQVKIYFPVAGIKDARVTNVLDGFFVRRRFCRPATVYEKRLPGFVTGLDLEDSTHLQMWVLFLYSAEKAASVTVYYH